MRAGTVAAVSKCDHQLSQAWSRYFYETTSSYGAIDGLIYPNAHNDGPAIMLYDRAEDALAPSSKPVVGLGHLSVAPMLARAMENNGLEFGEKW